MTPLLVFDIETVPDVDGLRRIYELPDEIKPEEVAEIAYQRRRQSSGHDFLPLHVHKVVAVSCALRDRDSFKVWSLGDVEDNEAEIIRRFFEGIEKYTPQLVSWNGGGFDLPVLHYRALINGVQAPRYWDMGDEDRDFRYNNYLSRYHTRHLDLMDLLALYNPRANAPLDEIAQLIGLPGKCGMHGSKVWPAYQRGETLAIRNYCETDVVNTYLVFMRFQLLRGVYNPDEYARECELVHSVISRSTELHWVEFVDKWRRT